MYIGGPILLGPGETLSSCFYPWQPRNAAKPPHVLPRIHLPKLSGKYPRGRPTVCLGGRSAWIRAHLFLPGGSWSLNSASIPIFQTVSEGVFSEVRIASVHYL